MGKEEKSKEKKAKEKKEKEEKSKEKKKKEDKPKKKKEKEEKPKEKKGRKEELKDGSWKLDIRSNMENLIVTYEQIANKFKEIDSYILSNATSREDFIEKDIQPSKMIDQYH